MQNPKLFSTYARRGEAAVSRASRADDDDDEEEEEEKVFR